MKRILQAVAVFCTVMALALTVCAVDAKAPQPKESLSVTPVEKEVESEITLELSNFDRTVPASLEEVEIQLAAVADRMAAAASLYDSCIALGYDVEHPVVTLAHNEVVRAEDDYNYYLEIQEELKWKIKYDEYPVATEVWRYMSETLGWSDYVCAGIMGNMMAECGGQTLNLHWNIYNGTGHYGLCQWSPAYFPQMQGASIQSQLKFLGTSTEATFNGWAGNVFGYNYNDFLSITDSAIAARIFCLVYERPGGYDGQRGYNAQMAYNYFAN